MTFLLKHHPAARGHENEIKPWRYHAWQKSADPQLVEKAGPVLELYAQAQALAPQAEAIVWVDEKTSIQARQRISTTTAAVPHAPIPGADRYRRMGVGPLFWALMVATGRTVAPCVLKRCLADFKTFWLAVFASSTRQGLKVLHLMLDKGSTHASRQLAAWIESRTLSVEVRIQWLGFQEQLPENVR